MKIECIYDNIITAEEARIRLMSIVVKKVLQDYPNTGYTLLIKGEGGNMYDKNGNLCKGIDKTKIAERQPGASVSGL